ncbi:MAG: CGNR zinc finger domain-containing protein [Ardenticatenaceae bacterium]
MDEHSDDVNTRADNVRLIGGPLCLDFCNTVDDHRKEYPKEYLKEYADLIAWGQHAGAISAATARQLREEAARHPERGRQVLARALALRQSLWSLFSTVAASTMPATAHLEAVNAALSGTPTRTRIVPTERGFTWERLEDSDALDQVLWSVVWSAADLLTGDKLWQVRECGGLNCSWLFLDTSRSRSRRWCSMADCGNRAKARRHYARSKRRRTDDR